MVTESRLQASPPRPKPRPRWKLEWSDLLAIAVAAAYSPALVFASNTVGIGHPERLVLLYSVLLALSILVAILGMRFGMGRSAAVLFSFVLLICLIRGAVFLLFLGPLLGWIAIGSVLAVTGLLLSRIERERFLRGVLVVLVVFLASGPLIELTKGLTGVESRAMVHTTTSSTVLESTPDIVVVVLDGYSGLVSFQKNMNSTPGWAIDLAEAGFQIPTSAWSSYPTTAASIPSLLEMSYVLAEGPGIDTGATRQLHDVIGGESYLVRTLKANGYSVTMVESGWSGSSCGPRVDNCVASAFLDEAAFLVVGPSIVGPHVVTNDGSPFTIGALRTMDWLASSLPDLAKNARPDFVFAHVMAPHAPFFLNSLCDVDYQLRFIGVGRSQEDSAPGISGYSRQAACVDSFLADLADVVPSTTTLVFVADHGTDTRNQLAMLPDDWDVDAIEERMNVLMAVRSDSCTIGDPVMVPNLFRRLLSCFGAENLPDLEPRMFLYASATIEGNPVPIVDVPDRIVELLVGT